MTPTTRLRSPCKRQGTEFLVFPSLAGNDTHNPAAIALQTGRNWISCFPITSWKPHPQPACDRLANGRELNFLFADH
ncbi:MAG: hypothetical protein V7K49_18525 [Nostoc sp.]